MEMLTLLKQIIGHDDFEITYENQNKAYHGMFCYHGDQTYRVRSGKFTPKKKGAFVVMWEKDGNNKNCKTRTKFAGNINDYLGRFGASYT